jgi:hypothetical protein
MRCTSRAPSLFGPGPRAPRIPDISKRQSTCARSAEPHEARKSNRCCFCGGARAWFGSGHAAIAALLPSSTSSILCGRAPSLSRASARGMLVDPRCLLMSASSLPPLVGVTNGGNSREMGAGGIAKELCLFLLGADTPYFYVVLQ